MSAAIATTYPTAGSLDNLGRTVMNWLRALLASTPAALAAVHGSTSQELASYYKVGYRMSLLRRASELDATSPRQAAQLRKLAAAA